MKKNIVRLTENDLNQIVTESVKRVISELDWKTYANAARKSSFNDIDRYGKFSNKAADEFNKKYRYSNQYGTNGDNGVTWSNIDGISPDDVLKSNNPDTDYEQWRYGDIPVEYYEKYGPDTVDSEWDEDFVDDNGNISTVHRKNINHNGETKFHHPEYPTNVDRNLRNVKDYDTLKQKYKNANDEFSNYLNGKYKYVKGKGWTLNKK